MICFFKIYTYIIMAIFSLFKLFLSIHETIKKIFFVYNSYF
nr:MAG TPA: hypothetical protein [Caudoviricetes sp.]